MRLPDTQPSLSRRQQKFLRNQLARHGYSSYRDYLHSDHWQELRERYRACKLPQVCFVCWDPNVDLHHKTYKRLGEEKLTDLLPLCRLHHDLAHKLEQEGRCAGADVSGVDLWMVPRVLRQRHYRNGSVNLAFQHAKRKAPDTFSAGLVEGQKTSSGMPLERAESHSLTTEGKANVSLSLPEQGRRTRRATATLRSASRVSLWASATGARARCPNDVTPFGA